MTALVGLGRQVYSARVQNLAVFVLAAGGLVGFIVVGGWIANGNGTIALLWTLLGFVSLVAYAALKSSVKPSGHRPPRYPEDYDLYPEYSGQDPQD